MNKTSSFHNHPNPNPPKRYRAEWFFNLISKFLLWVIFKIIVLRLCLNSNLPLLHIQHPMEERGPSYCAVQDGLKSIRRSYFLFFGAPLREQCEALSHAVENRSASVSQYTLSLWKGLNFKFQKIKGAENKDFIGWGWKVRLKALLENLGVLHWSYSIYLVFPRNLPSCPLHLLQSVLSKRMFTQGPQSKNPSLNLQLRKGDLPGC